MKPSKRYNDFVLDSQPSTSISGKNFAQENYEILYSCMYLYCGDLIGLKYSFFNIYSIALKHKVIEFRHEVHLSPWHGALFQSNKHYFVYLIWFLKFRPQIAKIE